MNSPIALSLGPAVEYLRAERAESGEGNAAALAAARLRIWDHRTAAGVDHFVANSRFIARRIAKTYRRDAQVIYPPVDTDFYVPGGRPEEMREDYYIAVSRLVGYKRVDLLVQAFRELPERRLLVVVNDPTTRGSSRGTARTSNSTGASHPSSARTPARERAFMFASGGRPNRTCRGDACGPR